MTEARFQAELNAMCGDLGLFWHHCRDPRSCQGPNGLPDLPLTLGPGGLLIAELKTPGGRRSPQQTYVGYRLQSLGLPYRLWTPADLASGRIETELRSIAKVS